MMKALMVEFTKSRACRSQGQRFGRRKKRGDHSQADRLRPHPGRACRTVTKVLYGVSEPVPELPSTVRVCHSERGRAEKAPYGIQAGGLRHSLAEVEGTAGSRGISQGRNQHGIAGSHRGRSDTEAAKKMGKAKAKVLRACKIESPHPPRMQPRE
jgi:hypothetical protein